MSLVKMILLLLIGSLPASAAKNWLLNKLGHKIHPTAKIDPVIFFKVGRIEVGAESKIWSFNLFRNLRQVRIGTDVTMMRFNRVWALDGIDPLASAYPASMGLLSVGDHAVINKVHSFDCSGGFSVGAWSGVGGRQVMVSTHSYDPVNHEVSCAPTSIGVNSMVGARTTLVMGATVPDYSALAMGGVLFPGATATHTMYGGNPARPLRDTSDWTAMRARTSQRPEMRL